LMRLVRLHPEVHCNYQAHFFTRQPLLKSLVNTPGGRGMADAQVQPLESGARSFTPCPARRRGLHPGARRGKGRQAHRRGQKPLLHDPRAGGARHALGLSRRKAGLHRPRWT
jgi:hypothetical protein